MFFEFIINILFKVITRLKKKIIIKKISEINLDKVSNGVYKNTKINSKSKYSGDLPAKLLGIYEEQIQNKILEINKKKKFKHLINFGAADGYHVIGLIKKKILKEALAFEINPEIQTRLINSIKKNNLSSKIKVLGKASFKDIIKFIKIKDLKDSIFLVDIEGEEFHLFNKKNLKFFKNSILIIENHEQLIKNKKNLIKNFFKLIKNNFKIQRIENSYKNPFKIKAIENFDEDTKWVAMSECRPTNQDWLVCTPKKII